MLLSNIIPECVTLVSDAETNSMGTLEQQNQSNMCSYFADEKYLPQLENNKNITCVICTEGLKDKLPAHVKGVAVSEDPAFTFFCIHNQFGAKLYGKTAFSPTRTGGNCSISPLTSVAKSNVVIEDDVTIEEFVVVREGSHICSGVTVRAGSIIGGEGYQFIKGTDSILQVKHYGGVYIGSNVEIQYNSCIDKGLFPYGSTCIGNDTKIDNFVHVSHGVIIGKRCFLAAGTTICGGAQIGDEVFVGINTSIGKVKIESHSKIGMGAAVIMPVEDGSTMFGNPARRLS